MWRRVVFIAVLPLMGSESLRATLGSYMSIVMVALAREASPFIRDETNVLLVVAQYQVMATFLAAQIIMSSAVATLGLSDFALGFILLVLNLAIVVLAGCWSYSSYARERERHRWNHRMFTATEERIISKVMRPEIARSPFVMDMSGESQAGPEGKLAGDAASESSLELVEMAPAASTAAAEEGAPSDDAAASEECNARVLGQYLLNARSVEMSKRIGAGAFGEVFKGTVLRQPVAIKTMLEITEANVRAFRAEILLTATLRHPNIVNFVGACWGGDLVCLVLEWVSRGTLGGLLQQAAPPLTWSDPLLKLACDVARGMAYLHGRRYFDEQDGCMKECIIHRDLKPENVLVSEYLTAKITDFGTSRARAEEDVTMTAVGTPLYCAPEIARGEAYNEKVGFNFEYVRWGAGGRGR